MKKMTTNEMMMTNGGIAFSTLCGYAFYWVCTAGIAQTAKSWFNRGSKKKRR